MAAARHYTIRGRVQGVGYRYFTQEVALRLGVLGYVRNTPDGGVEVYAEAETEVLAEFRWELEQGPAMARVSEVVEDDAVVTGRYSSFYIRG
jgi:acylphosphatase